MSTKFQELIWITNNSNKYQLFIYKDLNDQTVLFEIIQFSISTQMFVYTQLNAKMVLFVAIQYSISTQFKYQPDQFDS